MKNESCVIYGKLRDNISSQSDGNVWIFKKVSKLYLNDN